MTDLKVVLQQFQESERALSAAIRENGDAFIESLFRSIFDKYPSVKKLLTIGSTPYFNDGDLCTHSSEYFSGVASTYSWSSNPSQLHYDYEDYNDAETFFLEVHPDDRDDEDEDADQPNLDAITGLINEEAVGAKAMMEEFDTIFERIYGTNYIVSAVRLANGEIEVKNDDYDPGY